MMDGGIFLGGKHLANRRYVDFFLINEECKYNYIYDSGTYRFNYGIRETCNTDGMYPAAPVILAFWSE